MKLNNLKNKKIAFLGFGIENQALIKYLLKKKIKCEMTICDARSEKQLRDKLFTLFGDRIQYRQSPLRRDSAATRIGRVLCGETLPQRQREILPQHASAESSAERLCRNVGVSGDFAAARKHPFARGVGGEIAPLRKGGWGDYPINLQLGKEYNQNLDEFDFLFRSPGWPIFCPGVREALNGRLEPRSLAGQLGRKGVSACPEALGTGQRPGSNEPTVLSSPMKLFFDLCPTKNIIGVTGTKGKGTTSSLIYSILKKGLKRAAANSAHANKNNGSVWLGGNIGTAPFEFIDKIKKDDWVVLELSSFQLEDLTVSPRIAVITNFYKEHLAPADPDNPNYHRTLRGYLEAKLNIVRWQSAADFALINLKFKILNPKQIQNSKSKFFKPAGKIVFFEKSDLSSVLIGEHNKENVAAAVEVAKIVGIKEVAIKKAVAGFKGLEHRIELVKEINGVKYYNDSFATTPESSITALKSFSQPIILLAGGADKGADFKMLAKEIKKRVKFVVLLDGKATSRLKKNLLEVGFENKRMKLVKNIFDAVNLARAKAEIGDVVLLSTACASFGMFKNYKERGKLFKEEVLK